MSHRNRINEDRVIAVLLVAAAILGLVWVVTGKGPLR